MKKQILLFAFFAMVFLAKAQYPTFVWVDYTKSEGMDAFNDIVIDQNENVYAIGDFDENIIVGTDTFYIPLSGNKDVMFVKYDKYGNYLWAKQLGGSGPQEGTNIVISSQDEIYIAGKIAGTSYMGDIAGVPQYLYPSGGFRGYVSKFNTNGDLIWTTLVGGSSPNWLWSIELDLNEDVMVAGTFTDTIFFNNGFYETAYHQQDIFVAKYDKNGICQWSMSEGGYNAEWIKKIDTDSKNNFAVAGTFDDTLNLAGNILIPNGDGDAFVAVYDSNRVLQWYSQYGGNKTGVVTPDEADKVVFDSNDDLWVSGLYQDTLILGNDSLFPLTLGGGSDAYLIKFDNAGNILLSKRMGKPGTGYVDKPYDLIVDNQDNLYIAIDVANNYVIDDSTYYAQGYSDLAIAQFSSTGQLNWLKQGGSTSMYGEASTGLAINANREVYFCGTMSQGPILVYDTITFTQSHLEYWGSALVGKLSWVPQIPTGVDKVQEISLNHYPNPTKEFVYIDGIELKTLLNVYNVSGELQFSKNIQLPNKVNVSKFSSGIYIFSFPEIGRNIKVIIN